jgi:hypothetical protein
LLIRGRLPRNLKLDKEGVERVRKYKRIVRASFLDL